MAHYLMFIVMAVDSVGHWAIFIFARWIDNRPEVGHNEVSARLKTSEIIRAFAVIEIRLVGSWIITRYGYHCSIFFLLITSVLLMGNISIFFKKVRSAKNCGVCKLKIELN